MNPTIGIIGGKGRMGRLFAEFFKERGLKVLVSDLDTKLQNHELARKADIVIVSVPIDYTEQVILSVLPHLRKESAIMDFTSLKEKPVKTMMKGECEVLGMHPMFGDSNAIPGQTILLCPTKKSGKWSQWIEEFFGQNNVKLQKMTPREHDKIMNVAQGLIHFADITFADAIRRSKLPIPDLLKYAGRASELKVQLAARLINQDPGLYGNIQIENPQALKSIKSFNESVKKLTKIVEGKNLEEFKKYFKKNKEFLGAYSKKAYEDSSYLIDKFLEKQRAAGAGKIVGNPGKRDIAVLGPKNTYSDIGVQKYLQKREKGNRRFYASTIEEVFELVEKGAVELGIVPIENKLHGTVRETLDYLFLKKVEIVDEIQIPINHALIMHSHAKKGDIKRIISHSQALNQCKKYIKKNFPKAQLEAYSSTAAATEKMITSGDKGIAVIAPEIAAENAGLKILGRKIQDDPENVTTFIVIQKTKKRSLDKDQQAKCTKTSIAFYFSEDSPGTLYTVFEDFAKAKVNMTKIESRPTKSKLGQYIFYLDFDGNIYTPKIQKLLKSIDKKVEYLKILGCYSQL